MVCCINTQGAYGEPNEEGYFKKFSSAFRRLCNFVVGHPFSLLKVDGANGVGALKAITLNQHLNDILPITVFNDGSCGIVNDGCGADFVKTKQCPPNGMELNIGERCCSYDGDADRIVYYFKDKLGNFRLLDGDKIA